MAERAGDGSSVLGRLRRAMVTLRALDSVSVTLRRPNEYFRWRPRVDRGAGFGLAVWTVLMVGWQLDIRRMPPTNLDAITDDPLTDEEWEAYMRAIGASE